MHKYRVLSILGLGEDKWGFERLRKSAHKWEDVLKVQTSWGFDLVS